MTAGQFSSQQATALRLITKFGEVATISRKVRSASGDAWKPDASTDTDYSVNAVFVGIKSGRRDGSQVRQEDLEEVLVASSGLTITPDPTTDRLTRKDGRTYEIVEVEELSPNEDKILFTLRVRK